MLAKTIAKHIRADMRRIEIAAEQGRLSNWMRDTYHKLAIALARVEGAED